MQPINVTFDPDAPDPGTPALILRGEAPAAAAPAWPDITGKPSTFPPAIGATASTAVAGNDARLTAGAAGTATVRAIGTTATTASAGDHTHANQLMAGTAPVVNNATAFADLPAAVTAYNALLAALRTRGVIGGA